jgi:hypothetical protein
LYWNASTLVKLNDNTFPLEEGRKEGRRMDGKTIQ